MQLENLVCSCASLDRFTNSRIPVVFQANHLVQEMLSINRSRPLRRIGVEIRQSKRPAQLAVLGAALAALAIAAWVLELEGEESFNKNRYVTMFVCIPCRKKPVSGWSMAVWHFDIMVARLPSAPASCWRVFRHQGMFSSFSLGTKWDFTRSSPSTFVSRKAVTPLEKWGKNSTPFHAVGWLILMDFFARNSWMLLILWVSANPRGVGCGQGSGKVPAKVLEKVGENSREKGRFQRSFGERTVPDKVAGRFLKVLDLGCI